MPITNNFYYCDLPQERVIKIIDEQVELALEGDYTISGFEDNLNGEVDENGKEIDIQHEFQYENLWGLHEYTTTFFFESHPELEDMDDDAREELADRYLENAGGCVLNTGALNELKEFLDEQIHDNELTEYFDLDDDEVVENLILYSCDSCDEDLWNEDLPCDEEELRTFGAMISAQQGIDSLIERSEDGLTVFYIGQGYF